MAYAALLSLSYTLEQNLHYHLIPNKQPVKTLLQLASILGDFLENSSQKSSKIVRHLESQIRDAAYWAEDIIESHVVNGLLSESASFTDEISTSFDEALKEVIAKFDSIKQEAMQMQIHEDDDNDQHVLQPKTLVLTSNSPMVGLDDDLMEIKTRLVRDSSELEVVSIVGMGGIGKTTLARKIYDDEFIVYHFDIRLWVTVSQEYNIRKILLDLLDSAAILCDEMRTISIDQLAELLYKNLKNKRYLIIMDDVWDFNVWDDVKQFFPHGRNGNRIMLTTRLESMAQYVNPSSPPHRLRFLNSEESWNLFCKKVFGKGCPIELETIGKKIVKNCQGLPLAIVVIGGLLSKTPQTEHYWSNFPINLSSTITSNDDLCCRALSLSYNNLPHHLKGCLLYMGIFPEDFNIRVSVLVKLWVAEGFLKPVESKSLEDVAEEYLLDLVQRSLVIVNEQSSKGKIKTCKIHNILRNFCVSEAEKEMFFHVINDIPEGTSIRRASFHPRTINLHSAKRLSTSLPRSILDFHKEHIDQGEDFNFSLLRVLHVEEGHPDLPDHKTQGLVNLRYITATLEENWLLGSLHKFQNLQTLHSFSRYPLSPEVWNLPQLRHVQFEIPVILPEPCPRAEPEGGKNSIIVLENLQTLSKIKNFRCKKKILRRIPNLKKLGIYYEVGAKVALEDYRLYNLIHLHNLESLSISFHKSSHFQHNLNLPSSLRKLTLVGLYLPRNTMTILGPFPNLQVLKLKSLFFDSLDWEPEEGEFLQVKFLQLEKVFLEHWRAESIHFPSLERLVLRNCNFLEIPSGIGEIPTLQSIELHSCSDSVVNSARQIQWEQLDLGNDGFQVRIMTSAK